MGKYGITVKEEVIPGTFEDITQFVVRRNGRFIASYDRRDPAERTRSQMIRNIERRERQKSSTVDIDDVVGGSL